MGFTAGRMTFERFWVESETEQTLGESHLETLDQFAIGKVEVSSADAPTVGFLAGSHLFDVEFNLEKNSVNDALLFGVRIDTNTVPSPLRRAWLQIELNAMMDGDPDRKLTKAQKQEAKEAVEARCEVEVQSGKFRRMAQSSQMWDVREGMFYLSGGGEHATDLVERAYEVGLDKVTAGKIAGRWAKAGKKLGALDKVEPTAFHSQEPAGDVHWANHQAGSLDFLGNEFLMWLWFLESQTDTVELSDKSEVTFMLNRTLALECPLGENGKDTFTSEAPIKLPEASQAIRSGKLPRKTGLILLRHGLQYEFVMQAESFAISGAKISAGEDEDVSREDRIDQIRSLTETVDLLFHHFCQIRIGGAWNDEVKKIRKWIHAEGSASKRPAA